MNVDDIRKQIEGYQAKGLKLFTTSSFQSHSIPLLHILSTIDRNIPVYFINTGYHFPETVAFKDQVAEMLGLNMRETVASVPRMMQKDEQGRLLFTSDPDYCCHLNKVQPLDPVLAEHDVWINGVRADQSAVRKEFKLEEKAPHGVIRFHPMLDWNSKMIYLYAKEHNLPKHPLEEKGYLSIGCEPCTRKYDPEWNEREGRWFGLKKTECGLNTELVKK
ncbi:MAG: phosphoadenylyl-sulfate reductase [Cytophagaceae bacterium]|jgi:phosphoadenosine phosphosulfate reductase|nr:phosphoadenylyl-sulfate reductase [Cytophagaceae bacterium]